MQSSVARIVVGTCFLLDMAHRDLILDLWRQWFNRHRASHGISPPPPKHLTCAVARVVLLAVCVSFHSTACMHRENEGDCS